jgi:catechol 2,3-dioxygenase-like lactoylglutathione lyase family enzyme
MDSFRVAQVDHIELFVPDRNEAAAWYARTLGLSPVPEFLHWAADPHSPLMIATAEAGTKLALFEGLPQGPRPAAGFYRVAFRVDRRAFESFRLHIRDNPVFDEQGREVRELTVSDHGVAWSLYFCDPWGHRFEVTTYDVGGGAA